MRNAPEQAPPDPSKPLKGDLDAAMVAIDGAVHWLDADNLRRVLADTKKLPTNHAVRTFAEPMLRAGIDFSDAIKAHRKRTGEALKKVRL